MDISAIPSNLQTSASQPEMTVLVHSIFTVTYRVPNGPARLGPGRAEKYGSVRPE